MDKQIILNLTDGEYKKLMELFHLGYMIEDSITEKSQKKIQEEIEFMQKLSKQAHECGSKNVFTERGIYFITREMEDSVHECFEDFKEYIYSGEDAAEEEMIRRQIEEFEKQNKNRK